MTVSGDVCVHVCACTARFLLFSAMQMCGYLRGA